jgi:CheY-like chemotaxis protein
MFSIKISTAAKQLKREIYFERNADNVVETVRARQPSLVIFDLNSSRMRPLEAIAALKADPELNAVKTLGYVAHVDSDTIAAARTAGIDEVLARSAFTAQIGEILTSA